jgi:hypothetical protein
VFQNLESLKNQSISLEQHFKVTPITESLKSWLVTRVQILLFLRQSYTKSGALTAIELKEASKSEKTEGFGILRGRITVRFIHQELDDHNVCGLMREERSLLTTFLGFSNTPTKKNRNQEKTQNPTQIFFEKKS